MYELTEPGSNIASVNGIRLHYVDWGRLKGAANHPTVLLLHGDMRTSRSWDAVARYLCRQFHVIALDMRGHGDSEWPESGYTFSQRIDDLEKFADVVDMRDAVAVAHSTGGVVAAILAERRPDIFSKLMLLEPMVVVTEAFQRMVSQRAVRPRRTWGSREQMYDYLKQHPMTGKWRDDVIKDVVAHESYELPDGRFDMKWANDSMDWKEREGDYHDLRPILRTLGKPILFLMSDSRAASFSDVSTIAEETADFSTLTVPDSGHNMYMDQPQLVAEAVVKFASSNS